MIRRLLFILAVSLMFFYPVSSVSTDTPILAQKPSVNATHVVFVYAGDLWRVSREGGMAERLTTSRGVETNPVFSPDGLFPITPSCLS